MSGLADHHVGIGPPRRSYRLVVSFDASTDAVDELRFLIRQNFHLYAHYAGVAITDWTIEPEDP